MSEQFFDTNCNLTGFMNSDGQIFDNYGTQKGYVRDGKIYDNWSNYVGRFDSDGSLYDQWETFKGKIDSSGNFTNSSGYYCGSTQSSSGAPGSVFF